MHTPLEITGLTKVFDTPAGPFVAVKDVNALISEGEFVCILGHSGCGKSTVLSILAIALPLVCLALVVALLFWSTRKIVRFVRARTTQS